MLFDLRSRGRRRTVQVVYLGLALILGGGLVLFGVGTGSGNGGLLNAFTGSGSNNQNQVVSQQEKTALKQTKLDPNNPDAWANLVSARWDTASSGSNYDTATSSFTASGKQKLAEAIDAWQRYTALTKSPNPDLAILAARAYGALANYSGEAQAWSIQAAADPSSAKGYECWAASAYAAKETRQGDLALAKALSLVPKLSRKTLQSEIQAAGATPSIAQSC